MKGREGKGPPSTDLLVCFPSRAHLTLMPKPICSPARPQEPNKRHHQHHLKKSINRSHKGLASPVPWAKNRAYGGKEIDEPTSPRITCAGQIKVKPKAGGACKNWQSVMEEIERMHNHRKSKKRPSWAEALGFKKDVMQFLTCLRSFRFDFRCFGAFPATSITSDDDEDDDEDEEDDEFHSNSNSQNQNQKRKEETEDLESDESSKTVFSKWFMVLQEGSSANNRDINRMIRNKFSHGGDEEEDDDDQPSAPPPNALLLMRCRSAPAKSWLELKQEEEDEDNDDEDEHRDILQKLKMAEEEEEKKKKENLIVMRCGTDFNKFSSDIAKETWVVGGIKEVLSRSRSWKR